ncbi:AzlD family protein [Halomicrobium mukohataei]|uniref:Branched-chain amino acid transport n=2 Tax=Halomicrobium mukohataei TaxID=57705 RepID=C7P545_HALMD|nr:AzlD domain-containing protein [Halomicrobium mukohataei]ACV49440.1 branched-chain amino acid transport [Halomicrobium mukohataei DSM 12286]QCD67265.1 AzlD domain-containing protein [Halomicrobium mukohataei]
MVDLALDPAVVAVVLAMSLVTYATKAGGLWVLGHVDVSPRLQSVLEVLPGAIVVAIVGPELATGGPVEWIAGGVVLLIMWRTENVLISLLAGIATVLVLRPLV